MFNGAEFEVFTQQVADMEEKAFLDILNHMSEKYQFTYDEEKLLELAKAMKVTVDDSTQYPDWSNRDDIKAKLKVDLLLLLHRFGFPAVANDDEYKSVLGQAENFKKYQEA